GSKRDWSSDVCSSDLELSDGVDEYTKSIDQIIKGFAGSGDSDQGGLDDLVDGGKELDKGAKGVSEGASGLSDGLHQYRDGLEQGADQADQLAGTNPDLDGLVDAGIMTED